VERAGDFVKSARASPDEYQSDEMGKPIVAIQEDSTTRNPDVIGWGIAA
jgi:hypothetical protein